VLFSQSAETLDSDLKHVIALTKPEKLVDVSFRESAETLSSFKLKAAYTISS
jgi:hypothetical protein